MSKLLCQYLAGWIDAVNMSLDPSAWYQVWSDRARVAKNNDRQLVVFDLPKNANLDEIERYLQERYNK